MSGERVTDIVSRRVGPSLLLGLAASMLGLGIGLEIVTVAGLFTLFKRRGWI